MVGEYQINSCRKVVSYCNKLMIYDMYKIKVRLISPHFFCDYCLAKRKFCGIPQVRTEWINIQSTTARIARIDGEFFWFGVMHQVTENTLDTLLVKLIMWVSKSIAKNFSATSCLSVNIMSFTSSVSSVFSVT